MTEVTQILNTIIAALPEISRIIIEIGVVIGMITAMVKLFNARGASDLLMVEIKNTTGRKEQTRFETEIKKAVGKSSPGIQKEVQRGLNRVGAGKGK